MKFALSDDRVAKAVEKFDDIKTVDYSATAEAILSQDFKYWEDIFGNKARKHPVVYYFNAETTPAEIVRSGNFYVILMAARRFRDPFALNYGMLYLLESEGEVVGYFRGALRPESIKLMEQIGGFLPTPGGGGYAQFPSVEARSDLDLKVRKAFDRDSLSEREEMR